MKVIFCLEPEVRQDRMRRQRMFTPVSTNKLNSNHASGSEKWWLSGQIPLWIKST